MKRPSLSHSMITDTTHTEPTRLIAATTVDISGVVIKEEVISEVTIVFRTTPQITVVANTEKRIITVVTTTTRKDMPF